MFITLARRHGSTEFELLRGPHIPARTQKEELGKMAVSREHPEFAEVIVAEIYPDYCQKRTFGAASVEPKTEPKKYRK